MEEIHSLCTLLKFLSDYKFIRSFIIKLENVKSLSLHLRNASFMRSHIYYGINYSPWLLSNLFTCDEDNLDRESITLGTSAIGVG